MNLARFGGTKFLLALGAGIMTTILQWAGKIDPLGDNYMWVILGTVGAYITGNVAEAVKGMQTGRASKNTRSTDDKGDEK